MKFSLGKTIKRIFSSADFWPLFVIVAFGILAAFPLLGKGYFNMHDDLQMTRQLEMEKCFVDGQVPCRWVPDMGYGFGFPLFNFYPPLPYLVGQGIRLLGFDFVSTAKGLFALAFIASGVTMYFLAKEFFGRLGAIVSSIFFIWAPYHSVDIYVRGAMNESWAMIWFPLILWSGYKLVKEKKPQRWIILLALSWFGLLTSHNLMVLAFAPVFALWIGVWLLHFRSFKRIPHLLLSGIWAVCLAAFFTLPALIENKFTHIDSVLVGYYDYSGHFATINQLLFSRFWGYGPSVWLEADGMSFQIGHVHWILSLFVLGLFVYRAFKTKKIDAVFLVVGILFLVGWVATFLVHSKSTPVWLLVSPLKYLQFPWRFLVLPTFSFSMLSGALIWLLPKNITNKYKLLLSAALVIFIVSFNWNYFKPEYGKLGPLTDQQKFTGVAWDMQQTAGIYDYLPITAKTAPKAPKKVVAEAARGKMQISNMSQGTNWSKFKVNIEDEKAWVRVNTFYFPGWIAFVDGNKLTPYVPEEEEWGRMWIELSKGEHNVEVQFENTSIRTLGNVISLIAWVTLLTSPFILKRLNK